ncbi:MAG: outer membrane beta-barrel protein [Burkholderiales bacterium]|nr:outer membrane beta-barrel protein [Burkholderiales bacterium]MDE2277306.1 outer membrane beta-barrel protein [Burkholderiales bacterium]
MHTSIRILVLAAAAACGAAHAEGLTLKVGVIRYQPDSRSNGITGIGIPPGADAKVGSANTLLLTAEYELQPHWGVELVLGVPPKITATATGSVAFLGEVLSARNVAPTLLFTYHWGEAGAAWRPYVGLGVNYTKFTDAKSPYGYDIKLSDSTGAAAEAGVDYAIDPRWGLFASIGYAKVRSKLVATGANVLQTTIDFRPTTFAVGGSYKF